MAKCTAYKWNGRKCNSTAEWVHPFGDVIKDALCTEHLLLDLYRIRRPKDAQTVLYYNCCRFPGCDYPAAFIMPNEDAYCELHTIRDITWKMWEEWARFH